MKKTIKKTICTLMATVICAGMPLNAFAHSGRTDSSGGHHDYNNVSGLGSYHYHHGYPAHLHTNGVCPYETSYPSHAVNVPANTTNPSDIQAYITSGENSYFISSVNYKNKTYIVAEDLANYGYDVEWNGTDRTLKITRNSSKTLVSSAIENTAVSYTVLDSDIKTYMYNALTGNYDKITPYNIDGKTIIPFSEIGSCKWNEYERTTTISL